MADRMPVYVYGQDPLTQAGLAAQLRARPELRIVEDDDIAEAVAAVVSADQVDEEIARVTRALQRNGSPRVVLVIGRLDDAGLLAAIEAGACGLLRRAEATPEALVKAIRAAIAGDGTIPPDLLGRLLTQVGRLQRHVLTPRGMRFNGLTEREIEVLRLVADGLDTVEIARKLSYSSRTIKNVIHDITMRLNLRNRTHAVAYAVREGLI